MPQMHLPLFPDGVEHITAELAFEKRDGRVTYFNVTTVEIPEYWTPEQALAAWELLNEMADRIWSRYELPLVELIRADLEHEDQDNQPDLFDPDDSIPF